MTVVSNTSPLNYLILIGRANILPKLFGQVLIPEAVLSELTSASTPQLVSEWIANKPEWLVVQKAPDVSVGEMEQIQIGERQAICLAQEICSDYVLLDDHQARRTAKRRGVNVIGTLGILVSADEDNLINLNDAINDLQQTNFRASPKLFDSLLNRET